MPTRIVPTPAMAQNALAVSGAGRQTTRFISEKRRSRTSKAFEARFSEHQGSGLLSHCGWIAELVDAVSLFEP